MNDLTLKEMAVLAGLVRILHPIIPKELSWE